MMKMMLISPPAFEYLLKKADQTYLERKRKYRHKYCFITPDRLGGFAVTRSGVLCHVFSLKKGLGKALVRTAVQMGAERLSCYDGYLPEYYNKLGFREIYRLEQTGLDKVYMQLRNSNEKD